MPFRLEREAAVYRQDYADHSRILRHPPIGGNRLAWHWVTGLGGRAPEEEAVDAGFAYYARHFRSRDGRLPEFRGPLGVDLATVRVLTMPGDNNAWTMAIVAVAGDTPLEALRDTDTWMRAAACFPHAAQWLAGEPISDVLPMAGVLDRILRFVVDGRPIVTGLVPVSDSWACTNPTAGRGISLGLAHAVALRDSLRCSAGNPGALVTDFGTVTEASLTPTPQAMPGPTRADLLAALAAA